MEPSAASRDLARAIDLGTVDVAPTRRRLPLAVLRPPRLIARDDAWALMEEAWAAGRQIFITGDPGSGKTRLAQDFLRGKGTWLYLPGRPGDQDVPFASAARNARARLAAAHVTLPGWVRRELSRLLPELHGDQDLPPLTAESDRHTFFLAHLEMTRLTAPGFAATLNDDVQYYDPATTELGAFMFSHALSQEGQGNFPRFISVYRRGELRPAQQATVERMVNAGLAVRIELTPLDREAIGTLLSDLQLPPPRSGEHMPKEILVERLYHATGGNPQFVLETMRHIVETSEAGLLSKPSGLARGFEELLRGRLTRLSENALHTARAAAVLQVDFTPNRLRKCWARPCSTRQGPGTSWTPRRSWPVIASVMT
ncbi:AAA family ATPase [Deinococcus malanensis]|uniref:AAA family ATPase n=1 Tax=Deinococcus malanensis TaxID=1706855 RepID=UPI0036334C15